jgi:hypothetical protein
MNNQFSALSLFELTGEINRPDDERVDNVVVPPDPVAAFVEKAQLAVSLGKNGKPDWDSADKIITVNSALSKTDGVLPHEQERHDFVEDRVHPDGVEVEQHGTAAWKYHYKDGSLIRMECIDPELPGDGKLVFDGQGNELHAA